MSMSEDYPELVSRDKKGKVNLAVVPNALGFVDYKENIKKEIEEVLRLLKYEVGPSKEKDANKIDHKIANKIGDLKIVLAKDKDNCEEKALEILNLIKIDVAERKVYSK